IDAPLGGVLADERDRPFHIHYLSRPGRPWAQPVVDVEADPAIGGEVGQQRYALLVARPDHPGAAVDLDDRRPRSVGGRRGHEDVELLAARVPDAPDSPHPGAAPYQERECDLPAGIGRLGLAGIELLRDATEVDHRSPRR